MKQFYKLQKSAKFWFKDYYNEFIWLMHQPSSANFRIFISYFIFLPLISMKIFEMN